MIILQITMFILVILKEKWAFLINVQADQVIRDFFCIRYARLVNCE